MPGPIPAQFIHVFTALLHVAECIMQYITDERDIENLCVAGGSSVRRIIFRKKRRLRNLKTVSVLQKMLCDEVFNSTILLGNFISS